MAALQHMISLEQETEEYHNKVCYGHIKINAGVFWAPAFFYPLGSCSIINFAAKHLPFILQRHLLP